MELVVFLGIICLSATGFLALAIKPKISPWRWIHLAILAQIILLLPTASALLTVAFSPGRIGDTRVIALSFSVVYFGEIGVGYLLYRAIRWHKEHGQYPIKKKILAAVVACGAVASLFFLVSTFTLIGSNSTVALIFSFPTVAFVLIAVILLARHLGQKNS